MSPAVSVNETVAEEEENWPVSSSSRFSDAVWLLDPRGASKYEPPKYRVINWAVPLPGGTAFTDAINTEAVAEVAKGLKI